MTIPKYAYRVITIVKDGEQRRQEAHNYENLPSAWAYRSLALSKPLTCRVEVMIVLDEAPGRASNGDQSD